MDSKKLEAILEKGLNELSKSIKQNLFDNDRVVTGKTVNSLRVEVESSTTQVKGRLLGSSVLEQLEYGRGKTKNGGNTRSWEDDLRLWMKLRNKPESAFYPIWKKINEEGYEGTKGLVSDPINEFTKSVAPDLKAIIIKYFRDNGVISNK